MYGTRMDGCMISCMGMQMLQDSFQACDILISIVYDHAFDIVHDLISLTLLQVQDERSDGIRDLPDAHVCRTGNLRLLWVHIIDQWWCQRCGTALCVALEEDSVFVGPVWSSSVQTSYEEKVERLLESTSITVGSVVVGLARLKVKHIWVFVGVLRCSRMFMKVDQSSVDKMQIYLYFHCEQEYVAVEGKGLVTRCNLLILTMNKGRGIMDTYLRNQL